MGLYRHTAFFRDDDGHGWTETHDWDSASSSELDLGARAENFNALMMARRVPLLAGDAFYLGCRVSRYAPGSESKIQSFPLFLDLPQHGTKNVSTAKTEMDAALLAVKVTFADATGTSRADTYLRGVWEQVITAGQLDFTGVAGSAFKTLLKDYQDSLINGGYGWIGKASNSTFGTVGPYTVTANGNISFNIVPKGGLPLPPEGTNFTLYLARLNNSNSVLNRPIRVRMDAGFNAVSIQQIAAGPFQSAGTFYLRVPAFFRYAQVAYRKLASRKTGRPTGVGRGRLSARPVR